MCWFTTVIDGTIKGSVIFFNFSKIDISSFLNKIGAKSEFINGLRYTDETAIEVVQMVLGGKVNKDLVALIEKAGGKAIGLCGMDGSLLKAKKLNSTKQIK